MPYTVCETVETSYKPDENEELVSWQTKADLRRGAEQALGRKLTDEELDKVAELYNDGDWGEQAKFEEAVCDIVGTLRNEREIA